MSRSIRVRPDLIKQVKLSVKRNGFSRQRDLAEEVGLADSTVRNFLNGKPVDHATFREICQKLNLEWRYFADLGQDATLPNQSREVVDASPKQLRDLQKNKIPTTQLISRSNREITGTLLSRKSLSSEQELLNQSQPSHFFLDQKENTSDVSSPIGANSFFEYFSRTIEQMGSEHIHVRIGAISQLERLAKSQPAEHWEIMKYLAAFIRTNATRREEEEGEEKQALKIAEDIQATLTVIGRRNPDLDEGILDLSNTDIRGANLIEAKLPKVNLSRAKLQAAELNGANLQAANLYMTNLGAANLEEALLETANLQYANLQDATLCYAQLQRANLFYTNLARAYLAGADLESANLEKANLDIACLGLTKLHKAQLRGVKNLEQEQIERADGDIETVLPDYVNKPSFWMSDWTDSKDF